MRNGKLPRVLIYKRTHIGDPSSEGVFGIHDCLGEVRTRQFDAVIGIGGISAEPSSHGIDRRVNWVGIGPHGQPSEGPELSGPWITFDHFVLLEGQGPNLEKMAPRLARHMYDTNRRVVMSDNLPNEILNEVQRILKLADNKSPSPARGATQAKSEAPARRASTCARSKQDS